MKTAPLSIFHPPAIPLYSPHPLIRTQSRPMSQHHLVVFGATSFVGQILARYLWQRHGANGQVRWALAGRSWNS